LSYDVKQLVEKQQKAEEIPKELPK